MGVAYYRCGYYMSMYAYIHTHILTLYLIFASIARRLEEARTKMKDIKIMHLPSGPLALA